MTATSSRRVIKRPLRQQGLICYSLGTVLYSTYFNTSLSPWIASLQPAAIPSIDTGIIPKLNTWNFQISQVFSKQKEMKISRVFHDLCCICRTCRIWGVPSRMCCGCHGLLFGSRFHLGSYYGCERTCLHRCLQFGFWDMSRGLCQRSISTNPLSF